MRQSRSAILLTALLLGCATAEQPKEAAVDTVPVAEVNAAVMRLREAGLELVQQRDEAIELAKRFQSEARECNAGRST